VVGRVRSCAFGYTVGRTVALATLPSELPTGTELTLDVFGEHAPAVIAPDVLYDPEGLRTRG
jgi:4-methylaminobutanoate oxidase (formaldehyde-forming)